MDNREAVLQFLKEQAAKGGRTAAQRMTKKARKARAKKGAAGRWGKKEKVA